MSMHDRPHRHSFDESACPCASGPDGRSRAQGGAIMKQTYTSPEQLLRYKTLRELLAGKPAGVYSVTPDASVLSALQTMAQKDVGALVVLDGRRLAGVFSERDYARKIVLTGKTSKETPIADVMSGEVHFVTPEHTVPQCMELMTDKRIRHLPVVAEGEVIGMLSIGDLLKEMLAHHEQLLRRMAIEQTILLTADPSSY
jgi:CBS domain-containing protein